MSLRKIISGAQTGVDQAALRAAKAAGLETGGDVPPRCRTEAGEMPQLIEEFGLTEIEQASYAARTEANVRQADAVLVLAWEPNSPGTRLTFRLADRYGIACRGYSRRAGLAEALLLWLRWQRPEVLMVAGNRESVAPGIGEWAYDFLRAVFTACREGSDA